MNGVTAADVDHLIRCQPRLSLQTTILKNGYSFVGSGDLSYHSCFSTPERQLHTGEHCAVRRPVSPPREMFVSGLVFNPSRSVFRVPAPSYPSCLQTSDDSMSLSI